MIIGTNLLIHPDHTGPGKFGRRLQAALAGRGITLNQDYLNCDIFLVNSFLQPHEMGLIGRKPLVMRLDNPQEEYPWDGTVWRDDVKYVMATYDKVDYRIFQSEWAIKNFAMYPDRFKDNGCPRTVIYNGVPKRDFKPNKKQTGIFVSVCNVWNQYRMDVYSRTLIPHLHRMFGKDDNFKWMVVGKIEPLIKYLINVGMRDYIDTRILRAPFPADLDNIRQMADGFIHLVHRDACPNSVVESMMYGMPGFVWHESGAADLIGDAGYITYSGYEMLDEMWEMQRSYEEFRERAYKRACECMDIEIVADKYADVFYKVLNESRKTGS